MRVRVGRLRFGLCVMVALAGCQTAVPESGVGFGDYASYMRERERALESGARPPVVLGGNPINGPAVTTGPVNGGFSTAMAGDAIARADGVAPQAAAPLPGAPYPVAAMPADRLAADRPRGDAPLTIRPEIGEMAGSASISDEQDCGAVSARETIESDAERLARARSQYTVVQPTTVPQRPGGASGSGLVDFALQTTHAPGTPVYRRSGLRLNSDPLANCGRYASADLAQEDFLANGGPDRDRRGIDPDGDGFACGWDPRPFRAARQ